MVQTFGTLVFCGLIASLPGLPQNAPSRAASYSEGAMATPYVPTLGDGVIRIRESGTVEAHFAAANTTHDGHLTREQALHADWPKVVRHFDEIDTDHHGWVTVEQIHRYNVSHHKHRKDRTA